MRHRNRLSLIKHHRYGFAGNVDHVEPDGFAVIRGATRRQLVAADHNGPGSQQPPGHRYIPTNIMSPCLTARALIQSRFNPALQNRAIIYSI